MGADDLHLDSEDEQEPRSRALVMLTGLYFFLLLLNFGSYGHPVALFGSIVDGAAAKVFTGINTFVCLYLFMGLWQKQHLTWYLLLGYNLFEIMNTLVSLFLISRAELEKIQEAPVDPVWLVVNNLATVGAILWVSSVIYRNRWQFTNRSPYLF